ncbi:SDR family NAD(P)-dependent oxidoreductase [Pseudonocardia bannensis]|uniref:SDR family oxidoreductase n=1 Tax=Pseudonocardia bannensis TaxID=630973 RepID=A0A848DKR1_9PSEU|nr:SDR family NAD(P)-dependent oxidoreductase [Pseudonocardia bannensis]NMH93139.1 SDR family oxidoreductase [Pseudonocardia bannensis]
MGCLDDQVALIVGAAGGIGRAVVRRYLADGATVLAVDRSEERLAELQAESGGHPRLATMAADASTWAGCKAMVARAVTEFGGLDVLVSCVGVYDHGVRLVDIPGERLTDAFDECFRANVGSLLLCIRAAIEPLAARGGRIVVTGSFAGHRPSGGGVLYTSAKHAVVGLVSQLAYELAPKIRVNGVAPGVAKTVMSGLRSLDQEPRDALQPGTEDALPLQTLPHTDDYGAVYALLGSAESAVITGTVVVADSGLLVRGLAGPNLGGDL